MELIGSAALTVASPSVSLLGESPRWDDARGSLWWVDITGRALHELTAEGTTTTRPLDRAAGAVMLAADGRLLLATEAGLELFDPSTTAAHLVTPIEADDTGRRMNDAAVDPSGRVYAGTMRWEDAGSPPHDGVLYLVDGSGPARPVLDGLGCPNGLAWPQRDLLAYIDSMSRSIALWTVDPATGALLEQTGSIDVSGFDGVPDGMTLDADGALWVAFWNGSAVRSFALDGTVLTTIEVPTPLVTSVAFGGEELATLYITTATPEPEPDSDPPPASGSESATLSASGSGSDSVRASDPEPVAGPAFGLASGSDSDSVRASGPGQASAPAAAGRLYRCTPGQRGILPTAWAPPASPTSPTP